MEGENRARKKSDRIRLLTSFSKFKNTRDNPVDIDMEGIANDGPQSEGATTRRMSVTREVNANQHEEVSKQQEETANEEIIDVPGRGRKRSKRPGTDREGAKKSKDKTTKAKDTGKSRKRAKGPDFSRSSLNDDLVNGDDFVHRVPLTKSAGPSVKKGNKKEDRKKKRGKKPTKVNGIRTHTSPITLHQTCLLLSDEQKLVVTKMGLGSLLQMTVDGIPSKLGYYVVDNFDTDRMELELEMATIRIDEGTVHKILGLQMGGINLDTLDVDPRSSDMIKRWEATYKKDKPRPLDVSNAILDSPDAGEMFKLNFVVLFVNSMAECSPSGNCHNLFL